MNVNDYILNAGAGSAVTLPAGEFQGPLIIDKPLRLVGKNTTVWSRQSPVVRVTASGVQISDIRAEITEGSIEEPAIIADFPTAAHNVEVLGRVSGFGAEDGFFDIPRTIELGLFPPECENTFTLEVNVPARTEILCEMREVKFSPNVLTAGRNTLVVTVSGISAQTFLYAELLFKSEFTRRVYLTGRPDKNSAQAVSKRIYTAPQRDNSQTSPVSQTPQGGGVSQGGVLSEQGAVAMAQAIHEIMRGNTAQSETAPTAQSVPQTAQSVTQTAQSVAPTAQSVPPTTASTPITSAGTPTTAQSAAPPTAGRQTPSGQSLDMRRGQRVGVTQYLTDKFTVRFSANTPRGMEIDPYVFMLGYGDRAIGDEGLIFFGNECSENGEARYIPADGSVEIDLAKVSPTVQKIVLAYSIYDGGGAKNFRGVGTPQITLLSQDSRVTFAMDGLSDETTIVAAELYLYKGEWKISAVGAGYKDGLAKLCNRYGIEVEG